LKQNQNHTITFGLTADSPKPIAKQLPFMNQRAAKVIKIILPMMYLAGFVGLQFSATRPLFVALTPFNLWASLAMLLYFHQGYSRGFGVYVFVVAVGGFLVEVAGVKTGAIFGNYWYGATLGFKVFEVPLVIGANWLLLNYCANVMVQDITKNNWLGAAAAASLMTILDVAIEPVAIHFDFWQWQNNSVPLQNYMGWWLTAFVFSVLFRSSDFNKNNGLAKIIFGLQVGFFLLNDLMLIIF
jgi:bisanhydrobacterioruberin hydratase